MSKVAVVDIETLAIETNAVILSCGICIVDITKTEPFKDIVLNGINIYFDQTTQKEKGRTASKSTLEWWEKQGEKAKDCIDNDNKIQIRDFYGVFDKFCTDVGLGDSPYHTDRKKLRWFARGPHFDIAKLESMFSDFNVTPPWKYYNVRDIRTWLECNGLPDNLKLIKPPEMIPHNSLHDAAFDGWMMQQVLFNKENLNVDNRV
jgi:hypothetical protein